jgi:probable HAF family extracellular repeat protein
MNSKTWTYIIGGVLFVALALPVSLAAQSRHPNQQQPRYKLIDLGTLGGTSSYFEPFSCCSPLLNQRGAAAASAETSMPDPFPNYCFFPECLATHTIAWQIGVVTDLGPLPGGENSAPQWISANGLIVGLSENGETDPLAPGLPELRGAFWQNGTITDLGTLGGGYEAIANAVNSRGQVIGQTTNTIPDPFSQAFDQSIGVPYQTRAFLWQNGEMRDLGTLGGPDAAATVMNERGQIAGASYINSTANPNNGPDCSSDVPTVHPFLWQNGKMIDLGSLGGACGGASAINNQGQIAGGSTLPGDQENHPTLWDHGTLTDLGTFGGSFGYTSWINEKGAVVGTASYPGDAVQHAALWKKGMRTDLGSLPGYECSFAYFINASDQIVGGSFACDGSTNAATLWQNGSSVDLNTLIPANAALHLDVALDINDHGEIAGQGSTSNGDIHAFLLIPCEENHPDVEGCDYSLVDASTGAQAAAPRDVTSGTHRLPRSRWSGRYYRLGLQSTSISPQPASSQPASIPCYNDGNPGICITLTAQLPVVVSPGGTATYALSVAASGGFYNIVGLSCSVTPTPR